MSFQPDAPPDPPETRPALLSARLLIGLVVLICTEVFSGASLPMGVWHPWTLVVTYWLYFAHFFFLTTLAVRTGRTSLSALYLWGVLFGLYESWITKVIWSGYQGDGTFVLGRLGPYGYAEIAMVFLFHPVMAFILPLAIACVLFPSLRREFPDLAWITGSGRAARLTQAAIIVSLAPVMAVNSGGTAKLAANLAVAVAALLLLLRLARSARRLADARPTIAFQNRGFVGLCAYLALLYAVTYLFLRPEARPSAVLQLLTFVIYAVAIAGLRMHRRRAADGEADVTPEEPRRVVRLFALMLALGLAISAVRESPVVFVVIVPAMVLWTPLGFVFTALAFLRGLRESRAIRTLG